MKDERRNTKNTVFCILEVQDKEVPYFVFWNTGFFVFWKLDAAGSWKVEEDVTNHEHQPSTQLQILFGTAVETSHIIENVLLDKRSSSELPS